jgi:hypothetical protein
MFKNNLSATYLILISTATFLITASCKTPKKGDSQNLRQGVEGYIYELTGNQMPMKGKPTNSNKHGVKRDIYIYKATALQQTQGKTPLFDQVNTPLVFKTISDRNGHYKANLPQGTYSVFVKEDGKFFAAETDGSGILNPVTVTSNTTTLRDITITVDAAF